MGNRQLINQDENPGWEAIVLDLQRIAKEKRITQEMIAERTGMIQSNISRIFLLKYVPTLLTIVSIASAIGVQLKIEELKQ